MKKTLASAILLTALNANAALGPIPIYLNTEYRTDSPVIGSIASTLKFDAEDIKATAADTFLEFLATVPSVGLVDANGNVPAVFLRGGNSNHTLVLVDGVSINDISSPSGAVSYGLTNIALNDIEKIEIIKGSGSVLYGSSAISGIIAITTKKGADGENATISTKYGTHNAKTYNLSASSGNTDGFIRFTHNKYTTNGIDAQSADDGDEKDSIDNQTTQIKVGNKRFDIGFLKSNTKTEYDTFGSSSGTNPAGLIDNNLTKILLNANQQFSNILHTKLSFSQTKNNRNTGANATTIGDKYKSTNITILNDIKIDSALLNIGLSQIKDENITDNQKISSKDVFVNFQKSIESVDINTGVRLIDNSRFANENIYNFGLVKYLDNGIKIISNYSTAFSAPSIGRLFGYGANLELKPETSKNIELGLEKQHYWGVSNIKFYKNNIKDLIVFNNDYVNPKYLNADKLISKGVELSVNANITGYNVGFSHNYNDSKINDSTIQSVRRPKNTSNLTISKKYDKFNSRVQIIKKSSSLDDTTFDGAGDKKLAGYTLINLSTAYDFNTNANISLNINNALDKDYTIVDGYNQLGRTVTVGLNYNF
ncbi:TonB-dependent receptor; Outer membrane receptor for ferrienterochelin and colicins [uncultured Candidatus Thioglobus sp.]|nr:TonB-dependent receptor; Outer membrane receptor for ferrienterochelin and colicins [uncultured Candidatus Thioglobus sp.]